MPSAGVRTDKVHPDGQPGPRRVFAMPVTSTSWLRALLVGYASLLGLLNAWVWGIELGLLQAAPDHLLPIALLMLFGAPASLSLEWAYARWPEALNGLGQIACISLCGVFQLALLSVLERRKRRARADFG